jgi:hypothetical protein
VEKTEAASGELKGTLAPVMTAIEAISEQIRQLDGGRG